MSNQKVHPSLDLAALSARYHIDRLSDPADTSDEAATCKAAMQIKYGQWIEDVHVALLLQERDRCLLPDERASKQQMDAFILAAGDPIDRRITRFGGTPFWTRSSKWPKRRDGTPYLFAVQVNFADSKDIVQGLPGDILVVMCDPEDGFVDANAVSLHWFDSESDIPLSPQELKQADSPILPCYGLRYRTWDCPVNICGRMSPPLAQLSRHVLQTRIGGVEDWIQEPSEDDIGNVVCTIGSVEWLYKDTTSSTKIRSRIECAADTKLGDTYGLMWGDAGSLFLVRDSSGLRPVIQFY